MSEPLPEFTDNSSRPEDGDQSSLVQDPNVRYDEEGKVIE